MSLTDDIETEALMTPGEFAESLFTRPAWQADAACREHPEISWFPELGERSEPAKAVCRRCLCREACLDFALSATGVEHGVWAGTSPAERKALRRSQRAA